MSHTCFRAIGAAALTALILAIAGPGLAAPVPAGQKASELQTEVDGKLLMNRKVLKDLKCNFEQFDKIMDALEAAEKKGQQKVFEVLRGQLNQLKGGNVQALQGLQAAMEDAQAEGDKEMRKAAEQVMANLLTAEQRKRAREIDLQVRGYEAFTLPAVAKVLDLTPAQKEQIAKIAKQVQDDIAQKSSFGAFGIGGRGGVAQGATDLEQIEKEYEALRADGLKRAVSVLTDEQKAGWKQLQGTLITFAVSGLNRKQSTGFGVGGVGGGGGRGGAGGAGGGRGGAGGAGGGGGGAGGAGGGKVPPVPPPPPPEKKP